MIEDPRPVFRFSRRAVAVPGTVAFVWRNAAGAERAGFAVCHGGGVAAFANACPHMGIPLDANTDGRFFEEEGRHLVCSMHGAIFRPADGLCIAGPCKGKSLVPLGVRADGDDVRVFETHAHVDERSAGEAEEDDA